MMTGCVVLTLLVLFACFSASNADLTISTSTPTPCYGDVVTLVCHHPEVASNPGKYFIATPAWKENGDRIIPSTGIYLHDDTSEDLTLTTLTINITVDHFRNKSFNYSCLLVLAENGLPSGRVETSGEVTIDPVDLTPPKVTNIDPFENNITVRWTPQPCAVRYRVSWVYTNDDGTTTTGSRVSNQVTNYTIPTSVQGVYTVSVQAVDGVGNVGPATSEVVRSTYPRPTADAPPCEDRSLVLTCLVSGLHNDRRSHFMWIDRNGNLTNSALYTITGPQLMIANVSALSDEEDKAIRCCEVLNNGVIVEGVEYNVALLAHPGPPEVTITTTGSTITLTWNTALRCFESEMFTFVLIWNEIGSGTSTNVITSSSPYTISGLQPGTSYQISVQGVGGSGVVGGIRVHNVTTTLAEMPREGGHPTTVVVIPVVVVSVIISLVAVVITIFLVVARCQKKGNEGDYDMRSNVYDPIPSASSNPFSNKLSGTCCYAEVDFERNPQIIIPPPPVERVTYAEAVDVGEKDVGVCSQTHGGETKPELPTKQQSRHNIEKFRSDVVDALVSIGVDYSGAVETGGVPHFTAEYNGIHFVVTCMYTLSDVTLEDIGHVVKTKQATGSTKGLLISNQSTIPSECLLTLEDAGCQFVPVSGCGEEGWEDRMIDKFRDFFPKEPKNDSKNEHLPTSEQETNPPLSCTIQPGTDPAPVQYNNSNNNNIVDKRWTVPDEHCVESREETPPCRNDCSTSAFRGPEDEEFTTIVRNEFYSLEDQNVKGILSKVANDDSESEDLRIPEHVVDSSPMVLSKCPPPLKACPPPDYQGDSSGVTSDDSKTLDDQFRSPQECTTTIISGHYSMYMTLVTSGFLVSSFEYKPSDEEEVFHKRVPQEEVEEEEAMSIPVQETTVTTCPPPSTAASIGNLEYQEEPHPTAPSVASGESPEPLPMALTVSSHEYPDLPRTNDSNISCEQTSVSYEHMDVNDMETLSNMKIKEEGCRISTFSSWRPLISCFCEPINWFKTLVISKLVPEEDNKDSIISEGTDLTPVNQTPTQFSRKTYGFLGGLETAQDPSQHQQSWKWWTSKKTDSESVQYTSTVNDVAYNDSEELCYTLVHWSAHLFQTALHHSGALFVLRQRL